MNPARIVLALGLLLSAPLPSPAKERSLLLATTTSTQDSGLLDVLVPRFEREAGIEVKVIAVGTGAALKMASRGDVDVVLVHAPDSEKRYVESGDLVEGRRVMHNDFVIVGPPEDPAAVTGKATAAEAMRAIAEHGRFLSRGDESGTHVQELRLWAKAGLDPKKIDRREETGQGMGATLNVAAERSGYTLSDRGTFLALRAKLRLKIVFQGDPELRNVYHVHLVNPTRHEGVRAEEARAFAAFLTAPEAQALIGEFRRAELGEALFIPAAK